ncbi:MAG: tetratricopeptide repeat protein [Spirochaetes bacterium]|nr:tetratricopeptide repeat protein [Spirochaetota bacterium]
MKMNRKVTMVFLGLILLAASLTGADSAPRGDILLKEGIEAFQQADYQVALYRFREILANPQERAFHGDAYFWIARTYMALSRLEEASKHLEYFLAKYPENPYSMEGMYEKGRLLFLQRQFSDCIEHLDRFLKKYPDSPYGANAYYWIGEAAFSLGRWKEAEKIFQFVVTQFPTSFRVEAARYRLDVIKLKYREEELMKLLQWSHEEHLKALEEFQKREAVYVETIKTYQRRIALLSTQDYQGEILKLSEQVRALENELSQVRKNEEMLKVEKTTLENALLKLRVESPSVKGGIESSGITDAAALKNLLELLQVKQEALALKEEYLQRLKKEIIGGEEKKE